MSLHVFSYKACNCVIAFACAALNLSNSAAIGAYEVLRQWNFPEMLTKGKLTKFDW